MRKLFLIFQLILLAFLYNVHAEVKYTRVIWTEKGQVRGSILETVQLKQKYAAFKGIPYAEPPIGYGRRFRRPVQKKLWFGIKNTTEEASPCAQWDFAWRSVDRHVGSEDCLYLNVFTPIWNISSIEPVKELKAVMVYIHGGAFIWGSSSTSRHGPDFFIEKDVVMVSMNYRLGMFGFYSIGKPNIVHENVGLEDQTAALRWVQRNIRNFGGDPKKVTLFGESAGAASVEFHKILERSQGLFRASIAMSGSALNSWAYRFNDPGHQSGDLEWLQDTYDIHTSNDTELYRRLVDLDMHSLLTFQYLKWLLVDEVPYRPYLNKHPYQYYKSKAFTPKPHILGFMKDEGITITAPFSTLTDYICSSISWFISTRITNWYFVEGIDLTQRILTLSNQQPIYYYQNSFDYDQALHKIGAMKSKAGAGHCDDLAHLFWVSNQQQPIDPNSDIGRHREKMVTMWTNFAKYLQPIPKGHNNSILGDAKWERSNQNGGYLDINHDLVFHANRRALSAWYRAKNLNRLDSFINMPAE